MTKLEKKLRAALRRLGIGVRFRDTKKPGVKLRVVVAVSGGADSTALLDALARLCESDEVSITVLAAHLNHQLRGAESDADESFVRALAAQLSVPVLVERVDVGQRAREAKQNLEAVARRLRYDFLRRAAKQYGTDCVLTAHTQDDQAETILMRLLRGSGAAGLRGIHEFLTLDDEVKLIRPLLAVTRAEVIAHCEHYGLAFRTDGSNLTPDFTRNRVRRELLPLLRTFNPRVEKSLARAAELLTKDDACLRSLAAELLAGLGEGPNLDIFPLLDVVPAIRWRVLRLWLKTQRGGLHRIEMSHIEAIDDLIARGQSGQRVELPGGWRVRREFDELKLLQVDEFAAPIVCEPAPLRAGGAQIFGPFKFELLRHIPREQIELFIARNCVARETVMLREGEDLNGLQLRTRAQGDAYVPTGHHHPVKLKTLMIRNRIPVSQRDTYPVLATANGRIVWSPGLPLAREFAPNEGEGERALVVVQKLDLA